jgi:hypothetical protein
MCPPGRATAWPIRRIIHNQRGMCEVPIRCDCERKFDFIAPQNDITQYGNTVLVVTFIEQQTTSAELARQRGAR